MIEALLGVVSQADLGRRYGVARSTVASISQGRNWAYLTAGILRDGPSMRDRLCKPGVEPDTIAPAFLTERP